MPIEINFTIEKGFNEHNIKLPTDKNSRSLLYVTVIDVWNYQYLICQDRGFGVQKVKRVYELSHQCGKRENSRGEGDVTVGNGQRHFATVFFQLYLSTRKQKDKLNICFSQKGRARGRKCEFAA